MAPLSKHCVLKQPALPYSLAQTGPDWEGNTPIQPCMVGACRPMFFTVIMWIVELLYPNFTDSIITTYFNNLLKFDRRNVCFKCVQGLWTFEVMTQLLACFVYNPGCNKIQLQLLWMKRNCNELQQQKTQTSQVPPFRLLPYVDPCLLANLANLVKWQNNIPSL